MDYEEYYNNSGECINISSDTCGCCDTIREFYAQAKEWYENIIELLSKKENDDNPTDTNIYSSITFKVSPSGGGKIRQNGSDVISGNKYIVGSTITLEAYTYSGYEFLYWMVGSDKVGTDATLTHMVRNNDYTITAVFKKKEEEATPTTKYYFYVGSGVTYTDIITDFNKREIKSSITLDMTVNADGDRLFIVVQLPYYISDTTNNYPVVKQSNGNQTIYTKSTENIGGTIYTIYTSYDLFGKATFQNCILNFKK